MLSYEKMNGEYLGREQYFWFWNLAIFHTIFAEDQFSWHPLSLTNYTPSPPQSCCWLSINQTTRLQQEAEREESMLIQTTAILGPQL